jgi:REP element-mobilizing transposase RayT
MRKQEQDSLYAYMGAIIKDNQSIPIIINGVDNHVHILCILSKNVALSKLVEEIKRHSSRWIKTQHDYYKNFAWQGGYGGFSVSPSVLERTTKYIERQEEHHKKQNPKEEFILFLKEYGIEYDEEYIWENED